MKKFAVIVAGGSGSRMESDIPKQFMQLNGKPVLWYTLNTFLQAYPDMEIILVLPEAHAHTGKEIADTTSNPERVRTTYGGKTRFHSVKNGLELVPEDAIVFVHDAVRCLVTVDLIRQCYHHAVEFGNAIPAVKATDSIRIDNGSDIAVADRNKVYMIQTPQTFRSANLKLAYANPWLESLTDEATVAEQARQEIFIVEGERTNIKITWPSDLKIAQAILGGRAMGQ